MKSTGGKGEGMRWQRLRVANRHRCPKCASIIYSRKNPFCGICGIQLPKTFLFSSEERAQVAALLEDDRERHKQWLARHQSSSTLRLGLAC